VIEQPQVYQLRDCVTFYRTSDEFGVFSNFAKTPLIWHDQHWPTPEHLYQALKFEEPEYRRRVREAPTPKASKLIAHAMLEWAKPTWLEERVPNMALVLGLRWEQTPGFKTALVLTGKRAVVELTRVDDFWGAIEHEPGVAVGVNALGRLLERLRDHKLQEDVC
jgi:GTP cyclohydrolase II